MNGRKGKSRLRGPKCKLRSRLKTKQRASFVRTYELVEGESVYFIWREMRGGGKRQERDLNLKNRRREEIEIRSTSRVTKSIVCQGDR